MATNNIVYCVDEVHAKYVEMKTRLDILKDIISSGEYMTDEVMYHILGISDVVKEAKERKEK